MKILKNLICVSLSCFIVLSFAEDSQTSPVHSDLYKQLDSISSIDELERALSVLEGSADWHKDSAVRTYLQALALFVGRNYIFGERLLSKKEPPLQRILNLIQDMKSLNSQSLDFLKEVEFTAKLADGYREFKDAELESLYKKAKTLRTAEGAFLHPYIYISIFTKLTKIMPNNFSGTYEIENGRLKIQHRELFFNLLKHLNPVDLAGILERYFRGEFENYYKKDNHYNDQLKRTARRIFKEMEISHQQLDRYINEIFLSSKEHPLEWVNIVHGKLNSIAFSTDAPKELREKVLSHDDSRVQNFLMSRALANMIFHPHSAEEKYKELSLEFINSRITMEYMNKYGPHFDEHIVESLVKYGAKNKKIGNKLLKYVSRAPVPVLISFFVPIMKHFDKRGQMIVLKRSARKAAEDNKLGSEDNKRLRWLLGKHMTYLSPVDMLRLGPSAVRGWCAAGFKK